MGHTLGACPADGQFFDSQNSEIPGGDYGASTLWRPVRGCCADGSVLRLAHTQHNS